MRNWALAIILGLHSLCLHVSCEPVVYEGQGVPQYPSSELLPDLKSYAETTRELRRRGLVLTVLKPNEAHENEIIVSKGRLYSKEIASSYIQKKIEAIDRILSRYQGNFYLTNSTSNQRFSSFDELTTSTLFYDLLEQATRSSKLAKELQTRFLLKNLISERAQHQALLDEVGDPTPINEPAPDTKQPPASRPAQTTQPAENSEESTPETPCGPSSVDPCP